MLLFAVPSPFVRATARKAAPHIPDGQIIVDVAKGIEAETLYTMTEIIADEIQNPTVRLVALSGPTHAEEVAAIHRAYFDAGSNVVNTNTFGANSLKFPDLEEIISCAIGNAKKAVELFGADDRFVAFDMGPTGKLLEPLGDLPFEKAVEIFAETVKIAEKYSPDLYIVETMNDSYETKAAVLAVKENSDRPLFVSNVYDESRKLMTGASPKAMIALLEGLGADVIGINCSLGPRQMIDIVREYVKYSSLPVMVCPNAGLPRSVDGKTVFDVDSEEFSDCMAEIAEIGAGILGGCCGTAPEYITAIKNI